MIDNLLYLTLGLMGGCVVGVSVMCLLSLGSDRHTASRRLMAAAYMLGYEDAIAGNAPDQTRPAPLLGDDR